MITGPCTHRVDDFGSLAAAGAAALVALACSLAAIALYGVLRRERLGWAQSGTFDWTKPDSVADVGAAVGDAVGDAVEVALYDDDVPLRG